MRAEQLSLIEENYPTQLTLDYGNQELTVSPSSTEEDLGKYIIEAWREAQL
ncbi:hypothetical protein KA025_01910 [Candidatus Saccharibacteria bacterium]|jgi:hypothetical protein|nr:hypothetical protein [Candidatus Saccharibacteria bacterium]